MTDSLVDRLGLEAELEGHSGCVNCLEWNSKGNLLASGSDDLHIIIWDPFRRKKLHSILTGHHGNIFSAKFMPNSNDNIIVSGAADCRICVHDLSSQETTHVYSCHTGRVKRLATIPNLPFMFWSAAEDGTVMQFDLRESHTCSGTCNNVLISLINHMGKTAEAKCLAINPLRPELLAVGANDPYVRVYDRRMLSPFPTKCEGQKLPDAAEGGCSSNNDQTPLGCAQYFVAGHLPLKQLDFKKRYRTLASTYLTFSPDGSELLVNLGGEQIYLFDINKPKPPKTFDVQCFGALANGMFKDNGNGLCLNTSNGHTQNGVANGATKPLTTTFTSLSQDGSKSDARPIKPLPKKAELLKQRANGLFESQQYTMAINLYNDALRLAPDSAFLYGNRAAGLMKRGWDGDLYAALRDCDVALQFDPNHLKAHFRLARCLYELHWTREASECLQLFKVRFPGHAQTHACETLDRDIQAAIFAKSDQESNGEGSSTQNSNGSTASRQSHRMSISEQEKYWRSNAMDYSARYCGHCNTTTDIKEANYFGSNSQYIVAGSDDGSFFMWDRKTTNIMRVLRGDESIVNCLQPHPDYCLLATSGIDPVVRLWSPRPQDGRKDDREVTDSEDAALANQKRMNADPLEVMLMNMGYRVRNVLDEYDSEGQDTAEVRCQPS